MGYALKVSAHLAEMAQGFEVPNESRSMAIFAWIEIGIKEVSVLIDWEKAFQVALVGLSGVFAGLVLLEISTNIIEKAVRCVERFGSPKK